MLNAFFYAFSFIGYGVILPCGEQNSTQIFAYFEEMLSAFFMLLCNFALRGTNFNAELLLYVGVILPCGE